MAEDVDCRNAAGSLQRRSDLGYAVFRRIEQDYLNARFDTGDEGLAVLETGIDKS